MKEPTATGTERWYTPLAITVLLSLAGPVLMTWYNSKNAVTQAQRYEDLKKVEEELSAIREDISAIKARNEVLPERIRSWETTLESALDALRRTR